MNGAEIEERVQQYSEARKYFKGVYSSDLMPQFTPPFSFICNTDVHTGPGEHWVTWFVFNDHVEFFDGFGRSPTNPMFPKYFTEYLNNRMCWYNSRQLEGIFATSCGQFSIFYLCLRSAGISYKSIVECLSDNFNVNDFVVRNL